MPNMQQVRAPTTSVSGGAPVRHWLLAGNCNAFTDDFSSPSRTQTVEPGPPSNRVDKSKKEQCGQSPDKAVTESTAPFTFRYTFSGGRYKDANEGTGNVSSVVTVPLTSTPGRPSQNPDKDAASAQCASEVVAAPHKVEACTPTPKETRGPRPSEELSGAPLTLSREQVKDDVDAVQTCDPSHAPAREREALLSPLLSLSAPPGEHAGGVDRSTAATRPAPVRVAASGKNAFGQQTDVRTSANTNDSSTDRVFACAPETPHRPTQARFFRSSMPRWQGARAPGQAPLEDSNDEGSVDTQRDSKKVTQWRTPGWVLREETGSCAIPPPMQPAVSTSSPVREKGEEGSGVSGEDSADPDECDCLDTPTTTGVVRKQCQGNASLEHSPLSAVSILPRPNATHYATEDLSSAAAIEPLKSNCGSPISSSIPPHPNSCEESPSDTTPLRHSHTANPTLWGTGGSGHDHEGGLCAVEFHTPDAVRALPPLLQSASPSLQENGNPISRSLSPAVRSEACKRVPPSSGRGPSSSYGCSDGSSTLEGHRTRRRTSYGDTDEDDSRGISASQNIMRPLEESAQEAEQLHRGLPTHSVVAAAELPGACLSSTDYVVTSDAALRHYYGGLSVLSSPSQRENAACPPEADWRSALQFSYILLAEYQRSVLTALMTACTAAWLPPKALCTLGHVCANAYTLPRVAEHVPAVGITVPEVDLLFQLYCTAPSESAADRLIELFFATQLARYVNWVHHLQFHYMYVRMVALGAVSMMELHERRLICMQRDLGIRDAIELFMLLAPHPRAPKVSTGRRVLSAFRMALYALSGGGGDAGATTALAKRSGSSSARTQHKLSPPSTPRCVPGCQLIADVELRQRRPPPVEPLFASETWNADRAACNVSGVTAPASHRASGSLGDALNADRKVAGATNSSRERPEYHSGTQHLLCTTDPNECRPVAERSSGGGISSLLPALRLPKLVRSASRTTSVAHKTSKATGTVVAQTGRSTTMRKDEDDLSQNCRSLPSSRCQNDYPLSKQKSKDAVLLNGGLRAREKQRPRKLSRASTSPTDADFVNLRDAQVLKRFVK